MTTIEVPVKQAHSGINVTTGGTTTIQLRLAAVELLIGGPYARNGEEHTYGHMAIRVITSDADKTYDYGRYGDVTGEFGAEGEGILRVWNSFGDYIAGESSYGRATKGFTYEVLEEHAARINQHYNRIIASGQLRRARPIGSQNPIMREYLLPQKYHGIYSNCVTMSLGGAKIALPRIDENAAQFNEGSDMSKAERAAARVRGLGWPSHVFMPADVQLMLEANRAYPPKRVATYGARK